MASKKSINSTLQHVVNQQEKALIEIKIYQGWLTTYKVLKYRRLTIFTNSLVIVVSVSACYRGSVLLHAPVCKVRARANVKYKDATKSLQMGGGEWDNHTNTLDIPEA